MTHPLAAIMVALFPRTVSATQTDARHPAAPAVTLAALNLARKVRLKA